MTTHKQGALHPEVHDKDHSIGTADAPVTLVEYGDFQCPYCYRAHPVVTAIRNQLGAQLRFVFRNFPLMELHPNAFHAADAAESVAAHAGEKAYWAMHDAIFEHQQDSDDALDDDHLIQYASAVGANPERVRLDLDGDTFEERIRTDFMSGVRSGVNGTPTFFINGARWEGNWTDAKAFLAALRDAAGVPVR